MSWKILLVLLIRGLGSLVKGNEKGSLICIGKILPKIGGLPKNLNAIQGRTSSVLCKAESCFGDLLVYQWLDPQQRELSKLKGFSVKGGLLTIFNVSRSSEGEYTCRVADEYGEDKASLRLEVQVPGSPGSPSSTEVQIPPRIVLLRNLTREENSSATFECRARGVPKPNLTIRKYKDDVPFRSGDGRFKVVEYDKGDLRFLYLTITDVKRSDGGLYLCQASNAAGLAVKAGHLEVQFKPNMNLTPVRVVKAWSSNPGNLTCIAEANPIASLIWKFRGTQIDQKDERYQIFGVQSQSNLLVRTDDRVVFGEYTCEAKNLLGNGSTTITLEEAFAPGSVTEIVFYRVTPTTITFHILQPVNTGGLPITNYIMRYRQLTDPQERTVDWTKGSIYALSDLKPRRKYQFIIAACNDVGKSPWTNSEYVMPEETSPEQPKVVTKPGTLSRYSDRFVVRWEVPDDNGAPIIMFEIRYFKVVKCSFGWLQADQSVKKTICVNWKSTPTMELAGLQPDTFYKIQIRAVNKIGKSLPGCVVVRTRSQDQFRVVLSKMSVVIIVVVVLVVFLIGALIEVLVGKSLVRLSLKALEKCRVMKNSPMFIRSIFGIKETKPDLPTDKNLKSNNHRFLQVDVKNRQHRKQSCAVSYIVV